MKINQSCRGEICQKALIFKFQKGAKVNKKIAVRKFNNSQGFFPLPNAIDSTTEQNIPRINVNKKEENLTFYGG